MSSTTARTWTLRPLEVPADFPRQSAIWTAVSAEPVTVEELVEMEENDRSEYLYRLVAVDEAGFVAGFGRAFRTPEAPAGLFSVKAWIDPEYRGLGLGRQLCDVLEAYALEHGATDFESFVKDNEPRSLAFARQRGFEIERHVFESTLVPSAFDETPYAGVVEAVEASGIRFFTVAEQPGEASERGLYDLYRRTAFDIPGFHLTAYPPYEDWHKWVFGQSDSRPELMIIATDGDRFVGCSVMVEIPVSRTLYTDYTGVDKEYRGRGIALALKLLAIRAAQRWGAPLMRTNNDSQNAPMLAVNRKLGYVPQPGSYKVKRSVADHR
ncbi:MAG TPA: GNAT family N-acetyltransferase [Symbiobacteriaceae bacterium]|nr:GNAT family N-acetyltransferase [Symbiobacteriaceae bacterium]